MVICVASVAVIVRTDVEPLATELGLALIAITGTFKTPLPTKRAQPHKREITELHVQTKRKRGIVRVARTGVNVLSLQSQQPKSKKDYYGCPTEFRVVKVNSTRMFHMSSSGIIKTDNSAFMFGWVVASRRMLRTRLSCLA